MTRHLDVMRGIRGRVAELKRQGQSIDRTVVVVRPEMEKRFPAWAMSPDLISNVVRAFFAELP